MFIQKLLAAAVGRSLVVKHTGQRVGRKDGMDPEQFKTALADQLNRRDAELKSMLEKSQSQIDAAGKTNDDLRAQITEHVKTSTDLQDRLFGMEQEFAALKTSRGPDTQRTKTTGYQLIESPQLAELAQKGRGTAVVSLKAVTNVTEALTGTGGVGGAIQPEWIPGVIMPALRVFTIRDLLMGGRTGSNIIRVTRETGYQNMAAAVAEGTLKPESDISLATSDVPVRTLAHWLRASKQVLADLPFLQSYIDTRLTYGLKYVEEAEILAGDGTGEHLFGLIPQATAFNNALRVGGDTKIDTLRRAILQVRIAEYRASGIVLNPMDWADIELTKSTVGEYIWVNVQAGGTQQMWRLPVVDTNSMPAGHFLVGAFNMAAQLFDREDANVQVSTEDQDNFVKNMVTIRVEERLVLAVYRPESFVYGPFVAST